MKKIILILMLMAGGYNLSSNPINPYYYENSSKKAKKQKCKRVYIPYNKDEPHYNPNIKALFYVVGEKQDTFYYAIQHNDSIFLWAIVKGKYVRLIKDF